MKIIEAAAFVLAFATLTACDSRSGAEPPHASSGPEPSRASVAPPRASGSGAWEALDRLDARKPVPLLPPMAHHQKQSMRDHLEAVQAVIRGTAARDFAEVMRAGRRIGSSEAMGRMCEHLGAGAPGFAELALSFHRTADGIVEAAAREDQLGVLHALDRTLVACTGCHATYKQKVVDGL